MIAESRESPGDQTMRLSDMAVRARRELLLSLPYQSEKSLMLVRHWLEVAEDRLLPSRADIDPSRIAPVLSCLAMHHMQSPDWIEIRLAGTRFYGIYGRELTGTNYLDLVEPNRRNEASRRLHTLVGHPCALYTVLTSTTHGGMTGRAESIGLPLLGPDGRPDMAVYVNDDIAPRAFVPGPAGMIRYLKADQPRYLDIGAGLPDHGASP